MKDKLKEEALKIIKDINDKIYLESNLNLYDLFTFESNGYDYKIVFIDIVIWDSLNEDRKWVEDKNDFEPLKDYIIKRAKIIMNELNNKFKNI